MYASIRFLFPIKILYPFIYSAKRLKEAVIRKLQQFFEYFPTIGYKPLADFYVRNIDYDNAVVELKTEGLTGKSCRSTTIVADIAITFSI